MLVAEGCRINVMKISEARQYTCLAYAAFKNTTAIFKLLLKHARRHNLPEALSFQAKAEMIRDWVNTPTDEKFTAIHFATYHGNFDLIKMLVEELHADFKTQNVFGSSVIHIAAQGDQPLPLFYFIVIKNMDVNLTDNRGSTPLHWACYSRAEFALNYLLSMKPDLEVKDL